MRLGPSVVYLGLSTLVLHGCIEATSIENAGKYQQGLRDAFLDQINRQLAQSIDDPYAVPMLVNYGSAQITTAGGMTFAPTWTQAPTGITREAGFTFGAVSTTAQLNVTPQNSTQGMWVTRDLFAYELGKGEMPESERQQLLFPPPAPGWLKYASTGHKPSDCSAASCHHIGDYGKYSLFTTNQKSYSDFVVLVSDSILLKRDRTIPETVSQTTKDGKVTKRVIGTIKNSGQPDNAAPAQLQVAPSFNGSRF